MNSGFTHESHKSKTIEWYTPPWVFDKLGIEFDLDPCAPELPLADWIPAKKRYTKRDNGLAMEWDGRVWLNPPYGRHTQEWLEKMHLHRNGIALVFARTDTIWFHKYAKGADAILFLKGRIAFVDGTNTTAQSGNPAASMLLAWGNYCVEALTSISDIGLLVVIDNQSLGNSVQINT